MKTVTINKHNYSGETAEVKLYADGRTFETIGYKFILKPVFTTATCKEFDLPPNEDFTIRSADGEWDDDYLFGRISKEGDFWHAEDMGMLRESKIDPRLAAAMLLWNTI